MYIVIPSISVAQNTGKSYQIIDFLKNFLDAFPRYEFSFRSGRVSGAFCYTKRSPLHKVDTKLQTILVKFHTYREYIACHKFCWNIVEQYKASFVYDKMIFR